MPDVNAEVVEILDNTYAWSDLITAAIIAFVAIIAAIVLRRLIVRYSRRKDTAHTATWYTLSRLVTYTVLTVGFFLVISELGVPLSEFTLLAGALGVGLGFGLQSLVANFVAGIVLLLDKSLKVGDFVELESGATGQVRDIRLPTTTSTSSSRTPSSSQAGSSTGRTARYAAAYASPSALRTVPTRSW